MCFQRALHPLLCDVGSDVKVLELGVAAVQIDDQRVLLDDTFLLLLFGLSRLVALLHLLDDAESVLQVGGGNRRVTGSLQIGRSVRAVGKVKRKGVNGGKWLRKIKKHKRNKLQDVHRLQKSHFLNLLIQRFC